MAFIDVPGSLAHVYLVNIAHKHTRLSAGRKISRGPHKPMFLMAINQLSFPWKCHVCRLFLRWMVLTLQHYIGDICLPFLCGVLSLLIKIPSHFHLLSCHCSELKQRNVLTQHKIQIMSFLLSVSLFAFELNPVAFAVFEPCIFKKVHSVRGGNEH